MSIFYRMHNTLTQLVHDNTYGTGNNDLCEDYAIGALGWLDIYMIIGLTTDNNTAWQIIRILL